MSREMHAVTKMAKIRQNWQIRPTYPPTHPTDSLMNPTPPPPIEPPKLYRKWSKSKTYRRNLKGISEHLKSEPVSLEEWNDWLLFQAPWVGGVKATKNINIIWPEGDCNGHRSLNP